MVTVLALALAAVLATSPFLKGGVFTFIQEFQGYVSPGIVAAFVFGFAVPKAPPLAGLAALVLSAPVYGLLAWAWPDVAYLHRMVATLVALVLVMAAITLVRPLDRAEAAAGPRGHRHALVAARRWPGAWP